jgi:type VI secretion system protein VasD
MSTYRREHTRGSHFERTPLGPVMVACSLLSLPGCTANKAATCDSPPPFVTRVEVAKSVNPDTSGRSLPTVVQFLQVKDSTRLEQVSFERIWNAPKDLLGEDLLQQEEFVVTPGREVKQWVRRDPKAQFVAAMGFFRQHPGYGWITVARLPPVSKNQCEEPPAGDRGDTPSEEDTQLRFKLQGYQIDFLRPSRRTR